MDWIVPLVFFWTNNRKQALNRRFRVRQRRRPRKFAERATLDKYTHDEACHIFRLDKSGILEIYEHIKSKINNTTQRSKAIPGITKLLAILHYLATGTFQYCASAKLGISQPSFSRIFPTVIDAIVGLAPKYIKFPLTRNEQQINQRLFFRKAGFPKIIAIIDCTHISIIPPSSDEHTFRNRKQFHSINVQVLCGPNLEILDVVAKFPGCSHDSYILSKSRIGLKFRNGCFGDSIMLGDNGYRNTSWLLTPYLNPVSSGQKKYNKAHRKTRSLIERLFGVLKSRFRCLNVTGGALLYNPNLVCRIIVACCVLHNVANDHNVPFNLRDDLREHIGHQGEYGGDTSQAGHLHRQYITQHFFD